MTRLRDALAGWAGAALGYAENIRVKPVVERVGVVARVGDGVASVCGLPHTRQNELLRFAGGVMGMAVTLDAERIGCILLGAEQSIGAGSLVRGTGEVARVGVGDGLLGRMVDPLGNPLDGGAAIAAERRDPIERPAPGIMDRARVTRPLKTGILVIDAMLPLGLGQRELIVGDRSTGKTALCVDTVINQRDTGVICVYALIGQKASTTKSILSALRAHGAPERCVVVVAPADSPPGLQWLAPYSACTIAEYFRDSGHDALLVLDDLTKHAAVYRQLSLLLRAPPGREAYPGDIFYIHSRLLERAAQLSDRLGGGSLTALPVCETEGGNLTAYIPTNLVSITDGQIVCDPRLFYAGQKPAVDVGLSVSRVGGKSQAPAMRRLAGPLRLEYSQFLELEVFTRLSGMLDERARAVVEHGRRIRAVLSQGRYCPLSLPAEIALLLAVHEHLLDPLAPERIAALKGELTDRLATECGASLAHIAATGELIDADRDHLRDVMQRFVSEHG